MWIYTLDRGFCWRWFSSSVCSFWSRSRCSSSILIPFAYSEYNVYTDTYTFTDAYIDLITYAYADTDDHRYTDDYARGWFNAVEFSHEYTNSQSYTVCELYTDTNTICDFFSDIIANCEPYTISTHWRISFNYTHGDAWSD